METLSCDKCQKKLGDSRARMKLCVELSLGRNLYKFDACEECIAEIAMLFPPRDKYIYGDFAEDLEAARHMNALPERNEYCAPPVRPRK